MVIYIYISFIDVVYDSLGLGYNVDQLNVMENPIMLINAMSWQTPNLMGMFLDYPDWKALNFWSQKIYVILTHHILGASPRAYSPDEIIIRTILGTKNIVIILGRNIISIRQFWGRWTTHHDRNILDEKQLIWDTGDFLDGILIAFTNT